eukprot:8400654-Pyramimonas_sp.AAC.1
MVAAVGRGSENWRVWPRVSWRLARRAAPRSLGAASSVLDAAPQLRTCDFRSEERAAMPLHEEPRQKPCNTAQQSAHAIQRSRHYYA